MIRDNEFIEYSHHGSVGQAYTIKKVLHQEQTPFQKIEIFETDALGRLMTLDGKTMVSDIDEFVYHEVMAHVSCSVARNPRRVLVIGGGDGGVVRELVKHRDLEEIHLVEIDERVIEVSKIYFPQCTTGLSDPRVKIVPTDGIAYIEKFKNHFDVILVDSTDPEDFAEGLFTEKFYRSVSEALTAEGIMMAQTENFFYDTWGIKKIYNNLRASFPVVQSLAAPIMIYPGVYWTFAFASKKYQGTDLNSAKAAMMKEIERDCQWYNCDWHRGAFALPNLHKRSIGQESSSTQLS